ncbi:unnamed protein product [Candidula unifasciata]|uniref:Adenosine kinase n=1 Tax=Candidula unifasciata TaxID=100452 RepID=A0A8S3ZUL6_9EUPU|nr:unnamed protein product [Candidula unifasciata]
MASGHKVSEGILLGIGNPLLDISVYGDADLLARYGLEENNAVLATPEQHELFHEIVEKYNPTYVAGGATQNSIRVAQWLLQTPKATTFFGSVGNDKFRHILEQVAQKVGVNVRYQVCEGEDTGRCAAIIIGENRSLITELGAAKKLCVDYVRQPENWAYVEKARFFYEGGFLLSVSPEVVLTIARHSSAARKTLVMNLHATFLCKYFADPSLGLMEHIDVLFGNSDEAREFAKEAGFGTQDVKEIALKTSLLHKVNADRHRIIVITQGKDATIVATEGRVEEIPVKPVDPSIIVDTNGCGDAFVGGFLAQLVQDKPLSECLRCGTYAAREVIRHFGCQFPQYPDFV